MKTFAIGILAFALVLPAAAEAAPAPDRGVQKMGPVAAVNYTRAAGARGSSAYRGGGGYYRGGYYHGGYYGRGPYGYYRGGYGYGYPNFGYGGLYTYGYYGYPYAFGGGLPYGYPSAYYAVASPYAVNQQTFLLPPVRSSSSGRRSGPSFITNVQSALKTRGYYAGPVDGDFGPSSQKAIAAFQQANGMPATGTLDSPALAALGVSGKTAKTKATQPAAARKSLEAKFEPPPIGAPDQAPAIAPEPPVMATPVQPPVIPREPPSTPGGAPGT